MDYHTLSRYELESCLEHLRSLHANCGYPPMMDEYARRITMINFLLKGGNR